MLGREVALYRRLQEHGVRVSFLTYGNGTERRHGDQLNGIRVVPLGHSRSPRRDLARLFLKHLPTLLKSDVVKTNQLFGSEDAVWCKRLLRKKLIVRCGYLPSVFARERAQDAALIDRLMRVERMAFQAADVAVVASERDRHYVLENHGVEEDKVRVIPNYVLTDVFRPMPDVRKEHDLVCVAKVSPQKNIDGLLAALALLKTRGRDVSLLLLGGSSAEPSVKATIEAHRLSVTLGGNIPNIELPRYLNAARMFVLPSHYEGNPKALVEAMSCGLPCIGANVVGIRELIRHGETGWLCRTDPESIASGIQELLDDEPLGAHLGRSAREFVVENFDLERAVELELALLNDVLS